MRRDLPETAGGTTLVGHPVGRCRTRTLPCRQRPIPPTDMGLRCRHAAGSPSPPAWVPASSPPSGKLEALRDCGFAGDYVLQAMHLMLQQPIPSDYVVATGEAHCVREWCELAFADVSLDNRAYVISNPRLWRPAEGVPLVDDPKAKQELGWLAPTSFKVLSGHVSRFQVWQSTERLPVARPRFGTERTQSTLSHGVR